MRRFFSPFAVAFLISSLGLVTTNTCAQATFASGIVHNPTGTGSGDASVTATTPPESAEMMVLTGKITNPAGVLPGAVIILTATKQMAVTNADGEFKFVVPADAGPLQALVTYAGYADEPMTLNTVAESTINLADARVIVVARKQQLKAYLKTARKQVKRSLKQVR